MIIFQLWQKAEKAFFTDMFIKVSNFNRPTSIKPLISADIFLVKNSRVLLLSGKFYILDCISIKINFLASKIN